MVQRWCDQRGRVIRGYDSCWDGGRDRESSGLTNDSYQCVVWYKGGVINVGG